jgi:hypothetical protein
LFNVEARFHEAFCDISHRLGGITPFGVFSDAFPGLKITHFKISIAVLENVPPDAWLQKRARPVYANDYQRDNNTLRRLIVEWAG